MKNLKLLLLWWIFTLVWIFNFSNSQFVDTLNIDCSDKSIYYCEDFSISSDHQFAMPYLNFYLIFDWWSKKFFWNYSSFSSSSYSSYWKIIWFQNDHCDWINYWSDFEFSCKSDKMPVSSLTPAIDSLKNTTYQIIPYVVYIWIWTLLVVLWFYAIRWLVNWIVKKLNSLFSSKRG